MIPKIIMIIYLMQRKVTLKTIPYTQRKENLFLRSFPKRKKRLLT